MSNRCLVIFLPILFILAATTSVRAAEKPMKIALICSGSTSDGGWNQLAKDAMDQVKRELGAEINVIQKVTQDKAGDEMRDYASDGYDLVIAHGYEFLNPAVDAAKDSPKTKFVVSGADIAKPGIVTLDFDVSQASYQLGMIAATLSKTGKLGFIGGSPIPSVKACYRGFCAGARSVHPEISVAEAYTSWDQPAQSKSQTEAFFKDGIDAVYHDVDAASRGIFEAVKEHNEADASHPAYVFGCCADQNNNSLCPQATPASAVIKLDQAFARVARTVRDGSFAPGVQRETIATGTCVAVLNPKLLGPLISRELASAVEEAGKKLASGAIIIPQQ